MSLADIIAKQKAAKEAVAVTPSPPSPPSTTPNLVKGLRFGKAIAKSLAVESAEPKSINIQTVVDATVMSLDDLAETEEEGLQIPTSSNFSDEILATAPVRELPADLSESQQSFVTQLNSIYEVVHDPELFGQMIRTIMQEMQEHPDYVNLVADQDVHTMIRGLRESMGLAKIKKAEKSTKARGSKAAPKTATMVNSLDEMFNSDAW